MNEHAMDPILMEAGSKSRTRVLVSHPWPGPSQALAAYLAHLRPNLLIESVAPETLADTLVGPADVVVLCESPSPAIEMYAKGWVVVPFDGPHVAVAGVGKQFRALPSDDFDAILNALDDLVADRWVGAETPS